MAPDSTLIAHKEEEGSRVQPTIDSSPLARYRNEDSTYQTLEVHLLETGNLSQLFSKSQNFCDIAKLAGLLHDAGKASNAWQNYLKNSVGGKTQQKKDHATAGAKLLQKQAENKILAATAIQAAIMFHHGSGLPDMIAPDGHSEFFERLQKELPDNELEEIEEKLPAKVKLEISKCLQSDNWKNDARPVLLDACKNGCYKNSNGNIAPKQVCFNMGLHLRNLSSCLIDADRTDSAAFEAGEVPLYSESIPDWESLLKRLENHLQCFSTNGKLGQIREEVSKRCAEIGRGEKGIYTCSAVTGAGKTLASLRFALEQAKRHEMSRIFIIAPYTSIIDQNANVIRSVLENAENKGQIVLECHSNLTSEKKKELRNSENEYEKYEATWDAPIIVTTMVQFLETMFGAGTKAIRRMHRLANSVLVFDEIQTLPSNSTYLFNWGLNYLVKCCQSSALLCTATQPCLDKIGEEMFHLDIDDEIIKNPLEHFLSLKRVTFIDKTAGGTFKSSVQDVYNYIETQMKLNNSFLAVVNTKPQAKELFRLIKENNCADFVYHLSTNMCPSHRRAQIAKIQGHLKNGDKVICVSTRLIEAGVDLSFGGALRYMAGLDSIIQTAGRCNRNNELTDENGNKINGTVAIFALQDEKIGSLAELKIGQQCMERVLREFNSIGEETVELIHPRTIESFFSYYYGKFSSELLRHAVAEHEATVLDMLSDNKLAFEEYKRINSNKNLRPMPYKQAFKTAWENFEVIADITTGIIVPYAHNDIAGRLCALERGEKDYGKKLRLLLSEAGQYSVNVFSNQLKRLMAENMIYEILPESGIYALNDGFYDDEFGLSYELCNFDSSPLFA